MPRSRTTFQRGRQKTGGRKKGTPNLTTVLAKRWAQDLVSEPEYQENFRRAFTRRDLPPPLEAMVWQYAFGRPRQMEHVVDDPDSLPTKFEIRVVPSREIHPETGEVIFDPEKELKKAREQAGLPTDRSGDDSISQRSRNDVD